MSLNKLYNRNELKELLLPLLELETAKDYDTDHYLEGGEVKSIDSEYEVYAYKLGRCSGHDLYSEDELDDLCWEAYTHLRLHEIISDFDYESDEMWLLDPVWETNLRISEEALKELYYTKSDAKRLDILERAVEACEMIGMPFIDRWAVKMSRQALSLNANEALRCL
jgi:hypothetical protein